MLCPRAPLLGDVFITAAGIRTTVRWLINQLTNQFIALLSTGTIYSTKQENARDLFTGKPYKIHSDFLASETFRVQDSSKLDPLSCRFHVTVHHRHTKVFTFLRQKENQSL